MSISKRLKAAGHKGPHPLASWADDPRAGAAVGNLGLLDNPEANRRIADRLLRGPIADRPAKGAPDPGCIRADDPEFAELVREFGIPSPAAVTPEGAWYRLGSSFYRIGEGPFPKYLHPTGQIGEPWRPELPTAEIPATKLDLVEPQQSHQSHETHETHETHPTAETDVIRGRVMASFRRGRKSAVGQMVFFAANDSDLLE